MTFTMWWAEQYGQTKDIPELFFNMMRSAYERGVADERETAARRCEAFGKTLELDVGDCFAEAVRSNV